MCFFVFCCFTPPSLKWKTEPIQVTGGEAGKDGEAVGGGQTENGRGAKKVNDPRCIYQGCISEFLNALASLVISE